MARGTCPGLAAPPPTGSGGARDTNARRVVLEPDRYPTLRFRLGALRLEAGALPDGGSSGFTAQGELTLHGVTRPLTVPGTATREGDRITADAAFDVRLSEYDLMRPRLFFVVVEDTLPLTVHLVFAPAGPGG